MNSESEETIKEMIHEIISNGKYALDVEPLLDTELNVLKNPSNISVHQVIDYYVKNGFNEKTADIIVDKFNMLEDSGSWDTEMFSRNMQPFWC